MPIQFIIKHFEKQTGDVVWIEDVHSVVESYLSNVTIVHRAVDVPADDIRGMFVGRRIIPEPDESILVPLLQMTILYSSQQSNEYQRLVLCKELLHCLDEDDVKTAILEEAVALCDHLTNGEDTIEPKGNSEIQAMMDEFAKFQALAILFPMRIRRGFETSFDAKEITAEQIAEKVKLPVEYVKMVMSDAWPRLYQLLTK